MICIGEERGEFRMLHVSLMYRVCFILFKALTLFRHLTAIRSR